MVIDPFLEGHGDSSYAHAVGQDHRMSVEVNFELIQRTTLLRRIPLLDLISDYKGNQPWLLIHSLYCPPGQSEVDITIVVEN